MKILIKLGMLSFLIGAVATAQEVSIDFEKQPSWEDILIMAKNQNKPIFVDAYTTWCGPCKIMDRDVFTEENVVEYFNEKYINVKMDMEKGEGITLMKDWEVNAFPTLLYFDTEGTLTHRVVGAYDAADFLEYSKMALDKDKMALNLQKRYDAGERGGAFMYNYLLTLKLGYHEERGREVANSYLSNLTKRELLDAENWSVINEFMKDPTTKEFQYLLANIDRLRLLHDVEEVNNKFYNTIEKQIQSWFYWPDSVPFESEKETALIYFLQTSNYDGAPSLLSKLLINKYKRTNNNKQYLSTIDYSVEFNLINESSQIVNYAKKIMSSFKDEQAWRKTLSWLKIAEEKETEVQHKPAIFKAKSKVFKKLGYNKEAQKSRLLAEKAEKQADAEGKKIKSVPAMKMMPMTPGVDD